MISYIISAFNQPIELITCVTSLMVQKGPKEIIICDNTTKVIDRQYTLSIIKALDEPNIKYIDTSEQCPPDINAGYVAQNIGARGAKGDWLCFPSHDSYYVPGFQEVMLYAAEEFDWDFVYCDFLYDPRYNQIISKGVYSVVPAYPRPRFCDKNNFIIKKELFKGFPMNPHGYGDMFLHLDITHNPAVKWGKAPGVLVAHN